MLGEPKKIEQQFKLKKLVQELERMRGRHTELISIYIPADASLNDINNILANEISLTQNVKSKTVRKNVTDALTKIVQHLKLYKKTPEHGIAIFCGNVSEQEGKTDIRLWAVEPPEPIAVKLYWCDQNFELEPLKEQLKEKEVYGLVTMDTKEATIGLLKGKSIQVLRHLESIVPGKFVKGGQCVHKNTIIEKFNGEKIKIMELKENDIIKAFNFKKNKTVNAKCEKIFKRTAKEAYEIITRSKKIVATAEHLFFIDGIKERYVENLSVGDELLTPTGKEEIIRINKIKSSGHFYDLTIPRYENFIANGILVHNSAARFTRVREGLINDWYKEIAETMKTVFSEEMKGIILGGSGMGKDDFLKGDYIGTDMKKKVLGTIDVGYTNEQGLHELVEKGKDLLKESAFSKEKEIVNKFLANLQKDNGLSVYGIRSVLKALESGAVETILISEGFEWKEVELICASGHSEKRFAKDIEEQFTCSKCGQRMGVLGTQDGIDAVVQMAEKYNTIVEIISRETREGEQLYQLGGIGAILRWRLLE